MLASWRDGLLAPEEQADTLAHLRAETARLSALVERLLDLSRIESGRELVAPMPLAPRPALEAVAAAFRGQPGAPIGIEAPDDLPAALADPDAIHRMLHNLLENARRFTPETGRITLWAAATEDGVRLGVTDTGSGIAPEELARIWDRFARSPQARADGTTGSGLGLAIVKALAEAHGGQVGAESTPGVETTIWVQLPRADGKIEPEATPG
jgi:signal transduction histidine kinase